MTKQTNSLDRDHTTDVYAPNLPWKTLALVIESMGTGEFAPAAIAFLRKLVEFDSSMMLLYGPERRPTLLFSKLNRAKGRDRTENYLDGAYLLDPFYLLSSTIDGEQVVRMADIAPGTLQDSEYFSMYYKDSNVRDEVNFLIPIFEGWTCAIAVERVAGSERFSSSEIGRFSLCLPVIAAVARRHCSSVVRDLSEETGQIDSVHRRMRRQLEAFGSNSLTPREAEIVQLILRGRTAPLIATDLGISSETIRVHRRNIYAKLQISSLAELFGLALDSLLQAESADSDGLKSTN